MINNKNLTKLELNNINELQVAIDKLNPNFNLSAMNLFTWKFYDKNFSVYFNICFNCIYLYIFKCKNESIKKINILRPITKAADEKQIKQFYKNAVYLIKENANSINQINFSTTEKSDFKLFKKIKINSEFNYAYIYDTNQLKFMSGKKMQKKRNFVNFFIKNYEEFVKVEKYNPIIKNEIIEFCKKNSINKETNELRYEEIEAIETILSINSDKAFGLTVFYKDKIIGFTYGFVSNNKYEIFIEKADKEFKGSYQYLILKNLQINEIKTKFVDRQDDLFDHNLKKSKMSYKPIDVPKMYYFNVVK
ncbi:MAG: phosphatidylglycerol lysyltransferase domain-containing protein [Malacoplasma sp.]|nr:phosphatidylglycerol lysyltransferase domain-containing protein [Malacoplasma sp.]